MLHEKVGTIYMIGIKGTGMSSLAVLLKKMGYQVTGSDVRDPFPSEQQLVANGIAYSAEGFDAQHIRDAKPGLVIISTAYNDRNVEVAETKLQRIPSMTYPEAIGEISKKLASVAVCGSHGKTTTSSMLGTIMQTNGKTMTLTGTVADSLNTSLESPEFFVFEADEYQNKFQYYSPANVILTNIDFDHPDYFRDAAHYRQTFADFIQRTLDNKGFVIFCSDDPISQDLCVWPAKQSASYGFKEGADFRITNVNDALNEFVIRRGEEEFMRVNLRVYGRQNILDATASIVMASQLGIPHDSIRSAIGAFGGIQRRMQMYTSSKYIVMDDYGHHPTEIAITLEAIRTKYHDKNIVTVFHPHTFTRTKALLSDFGKAFKHTDLVLVLDIYPSAREIAGGVHAKDVVQELEKNGTRALYTPTVRDAADYILEHVPRQSVVVTMGAGDAWQLCDLIK